MFKSMITYVHLFESLISIILPDSDLLDHMEILSLTF